MSILTPVSSMILSIVSPPLPITTLILSVSILIVSILGADGARFGRGSEIVASITSNIFVRDVLFVQRFCQNFGGYS